jgi:prevent-host-death family protein
MGTWQLQEAKARLSELIRKAAKDGPQKITVHGTDVAVVISSDEYQRLKRPRSSFVKFMRVSPLYGVKLDLRRDQTSTRGDVDLE